MWNSSGWFFWVGLGLAVVGLYGTFVRVSDISC